jgi:hemolysin activation/secretion protein
MKYARSRRFIASVLLLTTLGTVGRALAQQALPPSGRPGAAERQLQQPPEPTLPDRGSLPSITVPDQAPAGAEAVTFTLRSIDLEGASSIEQPALEVTYRGDIGKTVSLARIYAIASSMTALYHSRGYLLSSVVVPIQTISPSEGRVRLKAVEGFLHEVRFEGYQSVRHGMLDSMRARLLADRPLRTATLERVLLLLNTLPGIQAQGVLEPAAGVAGAADLIVRIKRTVINATAGFNNRGATVEGPNQLQGSLGLNSLFGNLGGTNFQYQQASTASKLRLYAGSDVERLTASGLDLRISGSHSTSTPALGVDFAAFNLATDTTLGRVELSYPLALARSSSLTTRLALTYTDAKTNSLGASLSQDKLAAVRAGLRWDYLDRGYGVNLVDLEYSQGFHGLGASQFGSPLASRPDGEPDFSKATLYVARLQSLGGPFSVLLAASGQYAFNRLLQPEEFAFGGEPFGRAYDASEFVGDSGVAGKIEPRYTLETPVGIAATFYVFADRGEAWRRLLRSETGLAPTEAASSAGGGVRLSVRSWLSGYVEAAKPLDHVVAARGNQDARVFAGVQALFSY